MEVSPLDLVTKFNELKSLNNTFIKVVFKEEHTVRKKQKTAISSNEFDLQDYFKNPQDYESQFDKYLNYIDVLVNCIVWNNDNPRLVTYDYLQKNPNTRLKVIGDLSCDINGGVEICYRVTDPANPTYTYFPKENSFEDGTKKDGITVMAIDNLPCEFPREASSEFSSVLSKYVYEIYHADFNKSFEELELSYPIKKGLILHKGKLTKEYEYLTEYLNRS
ncbi:MAG: hypothetical protein N3A61_10060 [Ignavibacteria bacterium]|nr:hypothetical protein [Ignavibacteria bacterium]